MSRRRVWLLAVVAALGIAVGSGVIWYRVTFPYGQSHCCIILMMNALEQYADENGGKYPAGGTCPEAALSFLYKSNLIETHTLRGMTVPERTVRRILEGGGFLGPESCGWQYVPGLTQADDPGLALLWCKSPLGHNGNRTRDGGRQVVLVGRGIEWVSGDAWPAFLQKQKEMLAHRSPRAVSGMPLVTGVIELPDGTRLKELDGYCEAREETRTPHGSGSGTSRGTGCELLWYQPRLQDGTVTRTLSFSNLVSDPVTITYTKGIPNVSNYVFKMRNRR